LELLTGDDGVGFRELFFHMFSFQIPSNEFSVIYYTVKSD